MHKLFRFGTNNLCLQSLAHQNSTIAIASDFRVDGAQSPEIPQKLECHKWGGVTNGGLRGVWPPVLQIGRNRPFSPFFCLFCHFPEGKKATWKIQKTEEKGLFPQISSDFLKPPSLKPPFAALQRKKGFRPQKSQLKIANR